MSATDLLVDLTRLGIRLEARGDRLRYHPRSAVTPDVADQMKTHKGELLAMLRSVDCDPGSVITTIPPGPDGWPTDSINPPAPCPKCGSLELWESAAGDLLGLTPGKWRCLKCDPPTTARRLRELAARLRKDQHRADCCRKQ